MSALCCVAEHTWEALEHDGKNIERTIFAMPMPRVLRVVRPESRAPCRVWLYYDRDPGVCTWPGGARYVACMFSHILVNKGASATSQGAQVSMSCVVVCAMCTWFLRASVQGVL